MPKRSRRIRRSEGDETDGGDAAERPSPEAFLAHPLPICCATEGRSATTNLTTEVVGQLPTREGERFLTAAIKRALTEAVIEPGYRWTDGSVRRSAWNRRKGRIRGNDIIYRSSVGLGL